MDRRRFWLRLLAAAIAIVVVVALIDRLFERNAKTAEGAGAPRPIPVVAVEAVRGSLPIYLTGLGTVTPLNTVTVRSRVDGELFSVPVSEGQLVTQGQLLAEIDPRPFEVQLLQAQGQFERDQAVLANARVDLERYRVLASQDAIPKQQYDTQVSTVRQSEAVLKADQAAIESAKLQLTYTRITSPITGRVGLRLVDPGNIVHATDQNGLLVITQLQPISVIFTIDQEHISAVLRKLQAGRRLAVDAYDRDLKNKIASGELLSTDNQADVTTGTVRLKATFPNTDSSLFPNQFVNARLLLETRRNVVLVPTAAIQRGPQGDFVYVVNADGAVEVRNIAVGPIERDEASINKGVSPGETVVTEGVDKLQPGTKVTVRSRDSS